MNRAVRVMLIVLVVVLPLGAILGVGDIVHDPINYLNALAMYAELIKSYNELALQYELLTRMAQTVPVDMASRYRSALTPWLSSYPPSDRYGTLGAWAAAINTGADALGGYRAATESLSDFGSAIGALPAEEQARLKAGYGAVELRDGSSVHTIQTIGSLRKNAPAVERTIKSLEDDSLSLDPAMNTQIAVLNKLNAASIVGLRSTQDTNKLLTAFVELEVTAGKSERDAAASEINARILRMQQAQRVWAGYTSTMAQSISQYRLP